jgi:hypothetical protein
MSAAIYDREGDKMLSEGLYLDMTAWGYHIFDLSMASKQPLDQPKEFLRTESSFLQQTTKPEPSAVST